MPKKAKGGGRSPSPAAVRPRPTRSAADEALIKTASKLLRTDGFAAVDYISGPRWLSANPDKAWAERFFLYYSAVWPLLFGAWTQSGVHLQFGDVGNLAVTLTIASPNVLVPWAFAPPLYGDDTGKTLVHWSERYWFKFNVWIAVFVFVASYFWTEYFFDVLRMTYNFPHLEWNLDSVLLGSGQCARRAATPPPSLVNLPQLPPTVRL